MKDERQDYQRCRACNGSGTIKVYNRETQRDDDQECDFCAGTGQRSLPRAVARHEGGMYLTRRWRHE